MQTILHKICKAVSKNSLKGSDGPHSESPGVTSTHIPPPGVTETVIPPNFLKFRTITMLLAQIPRTRPLESNDYLKDVIMDENERRVLKISDAFAHIAGGTNDVIAVTTNHTVPGTDLQVLVTTPSPPVSLPSTQSPSRWTFLWTRNDQKKELPFATLSPDGNPTGPRDLKNKRPTEYLSALHETWIEPSLADHLWLLSKVLEERPEDLTRKLSKYIAAQSRKNIARRFRNKALSQPYYEGLKGVGVIPPLSLDRKHEPLQKKEFENDRLFLLEFLDPHCKAKKGISTPIDQILKKVEESRTSFTINLYTDDTRDEFHKLLLFLLKEFEDSLDQLVPDPDSDLNAEVFRQSVEKLDYYAYGLLRLARGGALRMHLEHIKDLLIEPSCAWADKRAKDLAEQAPTHDERAEDLAERAKDSAERAKDLAERAEDLAQQAEEFSGVTGPQQKSYIAWLQLILGHFDAVEILSDFVKSGYFAQYKSISIQILNPVPTSAANLDWKTLFSNESNFATPAMNDFLKLGVKAVKDRNQKAGKVKPGVDDEKIMALRKKLEDHRSAYQFFVALGRNQDFTGAIHCEAYLASVINAEKSLHFGPVIGVSKRCCPICNQYLSILRQGSDSPPFLVRGNHGRISACTLPPSTPDHVVDLMNRIYGGYLLTDMNTFMNKVNGIQGHALECSRSTGSGILARDSDDGHSVERSAPPVPDFLL
ncbi:uncharacterized protein LACBIDRAFT_323546 [Laccaria bicolor S238N-H82]|uniref:Predicted protein n=1 Tax=Laccaria bicolor (strain S238N-H82 / ATCC MYA-4686) TaxID=486041 RepID=B0CXZ3_LACBS|nr:uncharacterized protein LACBIDRAFT_323546 [Laccaria bicolor S238N-H82]EDR12804.1 predicted protein [Laccaria bicolor S238N-H82]|eukprot:XP_001877068.1 predicted protein [Laccaria bicolor S238N-H82]